MGAQSIGRWIKEVLAESGIDIRKFKAHSTRHAASSAALRERVSIDTIRKSAGWSEKSQCFAKFYNRPIMPRDDSFTRAIIEKKK